MNNKPLFITGIGTGVGKTIVSAVLVEQLKADYWKVIQSGDLHHTDTDQVRSLVSNPISKFHPESYRLSQPFSPHKSAALDGIKIDIDQIKIPETSNKLIIEGAGGLMVPLNDTNLIIDLIRQFEAEVILVVKHYLGSINHSLLSLLALKQHGIACKGIIFNGSPDESSESIIEKTSGIAVLGRLPELKEITPESIASLGPIFKS